MSLLFRRQARGNVAGGLYSIPTRPVGGAVTRLPVPEKDDELRTSVGWAAVRLRANLISTLPAYAYRQTSGSSIEAPAPFPAWMQKPGALFVGGPRARLDEWLYASQVDLDRYGNTFGIIMERDGLGRPTRIDLVSASSVTVVLKAGVLSYRINGETVPAEDVWHDRQYVVAGLPVGLSPVAYAAWTLGTYGNAQEFAATWFGTGAIPAAVLKNQAKTLTNTQADEAKARVNATLKSGETLVVGKDWSFDLVTVPAAQKQFLEAMGAAGSDLARFFDVPGDVIDIAVSGQSITYANLTQRNLQLLIMHIGPAVIRRESSLSALLADPVRVRFNTKALLRMDPAAAVAMLNSQIASRTVTVTEARELDQRPPLTPEQEAEFARLFPRGSASPVPAAVPADSSITVGAPPAGS